MGCCKATTSLANASSQAHSPSWKPSLGTTVGFANASLHPRGPHCPVGTVSTAPGARDPLRAVAGGSPAGRGKEEPVTRARRKGPISPSPNPRARRRPRRAAAPCNKPISEPSRKAGHSGAQVPAPWAASQSSLSWHCPGQDTHCGREEHQQHAKRWESRPSGSRRSWTLYWQKETPNSKHSAWWHLQAF